MFNNKEDVNVVAFSFITACGKRMDGEPQRLSKNRDQTVWNTWLLNVESHLPSLLEMIFF